MAALSDDRKALVARVVANTLVYGGLVCGGLFTLAVTAFFAKLVWVCLRTGWRLIP